MWVFFHTPLGLDISYLGKENNFPSEYQPY